MTGGGGGKRGGRYSGHGVEIYERFKCAAVRNVNTEDKHGRVFLSLNSEGQKGGN